MARPYESKGMIEELAMEIQALVLRTEEDIHPEERMECHKKIGVAANTICSLTSGLRTPKDPQGPRLLALMGGAVAA